MADRNVKFKSDFTYVDQGRGVIGRMVDYPRGYEGSIPESHAKQAEEQGALDVPAAPKKAEGEGQGGEGGKK